MSRFQDDLDRGYLENGEPLEALYGAGWWSDYPPVPEEFDWGSIECPFCGAEAHSLNDEFWECSICGKTYEDLK